MRDAYGAAARVLLMLGAAALASGCSILDRESYSLVLRKKAHLYQPPAVPKALMAPASLPSRPAGASQPELWRPSPSFERHAFRPFAYCYEHETFHSAESLAAILAAPAEYPLTMATHLTSGAAQGTVRWVGWVLSLFLPKPEGLPADKEMQKDRSR